MGACPIRKKPETLVGGECLVINYDRTSKWDQNIFGTNVQLTLDDQVLLYKFLSYPFRGIPQAHPFDLGQQAGSQAITQDPPR